MIPINQPEAITDNRQRTHSITEPGPSIPTINRGSISVRDSIRERGGGGGVGVGVSPRNACRQRSFTAENILLRATFQSQTRSMRISPRDASGNYVHSPSRIPSACNSTDHGDALHHDVEVELEAGLVPSSAVSGSIDSTPRMQMWPTAEPEEVPTDTRGTYDSNPRTHNTHTEEEINKKNNTIINSITRISGIGSKVPPISDNSNPEDSRFAPKGRMKRAYSDIFFQMAPPENPKPHQIQTIQMIAQLDNDNKMNINDRIGDDKKYTLYNPNNYKSEDQKKCSTICSESAWKILRIVGSLFRCLLYGLYAILVFGPTIHNTKEDEEGKIMYFSQNLIENVIHFSEEWNHLFLSNLFTF